MNATQLCKHLFIIYLILLANTHQIWIIYFHWQKTIYFFGLLTITQFEQFELISILLFARRKKHTWTNLWGCIISGTIHWVLCGDVARPRIFKQILSENINKLIKVLSMTMQSGELCVHICKWTELCFTLNKYNNAATHPRLNLWISWITKKIF